MTEQLYPNWLYQELIDDLLPWQEGKEITFGDFNKKYTLHDSHWIGIFYNVAYKQAVTLAIEWDAVWLPDKIKESMSVVNEYPYLFIRLTGVDSVSTANYADIGWISRAIAGCEIQEVEAKKFLVIDDVYGGQINIIYTGKEIFLALEEDRSVLKI